MPGTFDDATTDFDDSLTTFAQAAVGVTFDDPSVTFDDALTTFDGAVVLPPAVGRAFRLRNPSGGSALRSGDLVRGSGGVGVVITVDKILGGIGTGVDASQSIGQGRLISLLVPASGSGSGLAASASQGAGVVIGLTLPATGTGSGLAAAVQKVLNASQATGVGTGLSSRVEEQFVPTTALGTGTGLDAIVTAVGPPPTPATLWEVRIYDLNANSPRLTFAPVAEWSFGYVLNAPGSFEATVPLTNPDALEANFRAGQREIKVYRNNALVWGGYLWQTNVDIRNFEVRLVGEGYYSRLRRRFVMGDLIFENPGLSQEEIAWRLIKHTQNQGGSPGSASEHLPVGDLGITEGPNAYTTVRERDYCAAQHPNIADSIDELTQMDDGFDFAITPTPAISADKSFRTYSPRKIYTSGVKLTGQNTMTLEYDTDASDVVTRMTTVGSGDCSPPDDDRTANSIVNFGLLQDIEDVQFSNLSDVQAHGREQLRNRNSARWQARVEFSEHDGPAWGTADVGDTINVRASKGYAQFNQDFRILEYNVSLQPGIREAFSSWTLDSVVAA